MEPKKKVFTRADMANIKRNHKQTPQILEIDDVAKVRFDTKNGQTNGSSRPSNGHAQRQSNVKTGLAARLEDQQHGSLATKLRHNEYPNCNLLPPYKGKIVEYIDPINVSQRAAGWWKGGQIEVWAQEEARDRAKKFDSMTPEQRDSTVAAIDSILEELDNIPDKTGPQEGEEETQTKKISKGEDKRKSSIEAHSDRLGDLLGNAETLATSSAPSASTSASGTSSSGTNGSSIAAGARKKNLFSFYERSVKDLLVQNHDLIMDLKDALNKQAKKTVRKEDIYTSPKVAALWQPLQTKVLHPLVVDIFSGPLSLGELQDLTNLPRSYLKAHFKLLLEGKSKFDKTIAEEGDGRRDSSNKYTGPLMVLEFNENHLKDRYEYLIVSRERDFFVRCILPHIPASMPIPLNVLWRCTQWDRSMVAGLEIKDQVALQGAQPKPLGTPGKDLSCLLLYLFEFVKSGDLRLNLKRGLVQRAVMTELSPMEKLAWSLKFTSYGPKYLKEVEQGPVVEKRKTAMLRAERFKARAAEFVNQRPNPR